jgi:hypothetical protein
MEPGTGRKEGRGTGREEKHKVGGTNTREERRRRKRARSSGGEESRRGEGAVKERDQGRSGIR